MKLIESILTKNPCYKAGKKITVKGLMLHSTGCPQPSARTFLSSWNKESYKNACVHAFIDGNDGTVYQSLPWDHRGWHCGTGANGSGNNTHIGVEMCEPSSIMYTGGSSFSCIDANEAKKVVKRTYEAAVELFAMLCKKYDLDPVADGVIISHKEGCRKGIASNHGDPEHLWTQLGMGYTMDGFRKAVKAAMADAPANSDKEILYRVRKTWENASSQKGAFKELKNAKDCANDNPGYTVFDVEGKALYISAPVEALKPFLVRVLTPRLNIRKGPGTDKEKTGMYTGVGTCTIVDISKGKGSDSGWGLLKSYEKNRDGWIALDYTEKV